MNWIAHIFLSELNTDFQIGNYLADPLKGKVWENANENIKKGMYVHKIIDSYTDSHLFFKNSKNKLGSKGLLKAVVIDLTYDYLLTKNWDKFSNIPINKFLDEFHMNAMKKLDSLPLTAQTPLERLIRHDILNQYKTLSDLEKAFLRVDYKLSQRLLKRDTTHRYFDIVNSNIDSIEEDFLIFFPQLCKEVKKHISDDKSNHIII
ncbi:acyl carrier protein phosphodiesterase [Halarcobacter sp.]|uniref:acyl carrier protein phosphodiesterase n=1 Tax=Halarcobacter sp. TaxID=2321133 RepID=UPI002AA81BB0|nr:acyl carrier protein phosphodiesterase [Halarcobacter sp.]